MRARQTCVSENSPPPSSNGSMEWRDVRRVPVEDEDGHLVGIVSHRSLLHMLAEGTSSGVEGLVAVRQIMSRNPVSVAPTTTVRRRSN